MNRLRHLVLLGGSLLLLGLAGCTGPAQGGPENAPAGETTTGRESKAMAPAPERPAGSAVATFAGGCFWCMEPPFDKLDGVYSTTSGYTGGPEENPTYEQVSNGQTGHAESVQVVYDPAKISYQQLLDVFWHNIDPTVENRQFCDHGPQYRTAIYAQDDEQMRLAAASKQALVDAGKFPAVVTEVVAASTFYPAEEYHQDFYQKNPVRYQSYRFGCGRDRRLEELWGEAAGH